MQSRAEVGERCAFPLGDNGAKCAGSTVRCGCGGGLPDRLCVREHHGNQRHVANRAGALPGDPRRAIHEFWPHWRRRERSPSTLPANVRGPRRAPLRGYRSPVARKDRGRALSRSGSVRTPIRARGGRPSASPTRAVQLAQDAAPCRYSVAAGDTTAPAAGGDLSIDIRTHALCNWTVASPVPWMSTSPASGKGDGTHSRRRHGEYEPGAPIGGGHRCRAERHVVAGLEGSHAAPSCPGAARAGSARAGPAAPTPPAPTPPAPTPPAPTPPPPPPPVLVHVPDSRRARCRVPGDRRFRARFDLHTRPRARGPRSSNAAGCPSTPPSGAGKLDVRFTVAENFSPTSRIATADDRRSKTFRVTQAAAEEIRLRGRDLRR